MRGFLHIICAIVFVLAALALAFAIYGNVLYWNDLADGVCDHCQYGPVTSREQIMQAAMITIAIYGVPMALSAWGFLATRRHR